VLADTLASSLAGLASAATSAADTPDELKKADTPDELKKKALDLAVNDIAAPFLHAGSETLGDAVAGALARKVGLTEKPAVPPSKKAVAQVNATLQQKLIAELVSMPNLRVVTDYAGLTPNQLATRLAGTIAQREAGDLAGGLVRLPPSPRLDDPSLIPFLEQVIERLLPKPPPPTVAYTVQPGDSLWGISQQLLGPGATSNEIDLAWQVIYRDNHTTIGTNPNRLVPGQVLRIPSTRESALSQGWVVLPWLVVGPGTLTGIAIRRRRRSNRARSRPAAQAEVEEDPAELARWSQGSAPMLAERARAPLLCLGVGCFDGGDVGLEYLLVVVLEQRRHLHRVDLVLFVRHEPADVLAELLLGAEVDQLRPQDGDGSGEQRGNGSDDAGRAAAERGEYCLDSSGSGGEQCPGQDRGRVPVHLLFPLSPASAGCGGVGQDGGTFPMPRARFF
jgi:nucleoid-associated protein YgaU